MLFKYRPFPKHNNDVFDLFNDFMFESRELLTDISDDGVLKMEMDLPGVKKGDLELTYNDQKIIIDAKRGEKSLKKTVLVHESYDLSTAQASLEDGVLTVKVKKKQNDGVGKIVVT